MILLFLSILLLIHMSLDIFYCCHLGPSFFCCSTAVHLLNIVEHAVRMVIALPILNDEISYCLNQLLCENLRTRFSFFSAKEFF
jgi:hypothetical protein